MDSTALCDRLGGGADPVALNIHSPSITDSMSGYDSTSMDYMDMSGGCPGHCTSGLDTDSAFSDTMSLPSSGSHISVITTSSHHSGSSCGSGGAVHSPTPVSTLTPYTHTYIDARTWAYPPNTHNHTNPYTHTHTHTHIHCLLTK